MKQQILQKLDELSVDLVEIVEVNIFLEDEAAIIEDSKELDRSVKELSEELRNVDEFKDIKN